MLLQLNQSFGLNVAYHAKYFYIMCCECDDNDGYRHRHKSTRHPSSPFKHKIIDSVNSQLMKMIT